MWRRIGPSLAGVATAGGIAMCADAKLSTTSTTSRIKALAKRIGALEAASGLVPQLSARLLSVGDDKTSNAIISYFEENNTFLTLAQNQTDAIVQRDAEDDEKLAAGIQIAVDKGVLPANVDVEPTVQVDVTGKTADQVADEIISHLGDMSSGKTIILSGLSGTGKGTTVSKLEQKLPNVVCWSNGNLFRSMTLFAVEYCKQNAIDFKGENLSPDLLQECLGMLKFCDAADTALGDRIRRQVQCLVHRCLRPFACAAIGETA